MNIAEILKNVPKGTKLYSTVFGDVELVEIDDKSDYPIKVSVCNSDSYESFTKEGKFNNKVANAECILFPSEENRDWNKFKVEKSYEFKPFDKVLVRDNEADNWTCECFSHMHGDTYVCSGAGVWNYCIPYNDETKHLVGTNKTI